MTHSRCQTIPNSYQTSCLTTKLCNSFSLVSYHWTTGGGPGRCAWGCSNGGNGNTNGVHDNAGSASWTGSGARSGGVDGDGGANSATAAAAAATSTTTTLTSTGNRSSRGSNSCILICFSYCGQFYIAPDWMLAWTRLSLNCSVNKTDLKLFRRQILWLEPFKINKNNKKLLDLWTECDNQPTDGTDETRINQKINTNRDDTKEKIEVRERLRL